MISKEEGARQQDVRTCEKKIQELEKLLLVPTNSKSHETLAWEVGDSRVNSRVPHFLQGFK